VAAKFDPSEKFRYLEKSCARSIGAVKSRTTNQRTAVRIVFIEHLVKNSKNFENSRELRHPKTGDSSLQYRVVSLNQLRGFSSPPRPR
jgi:hypothetical protein